MVIYIQNRMDRLRTLLMLILIVSSNVIEAQAPQSFNYQAVARDASGNILANTAVSIRISVHQGSSTGTIVYSESFAANTNQFGLFTLNIGQGAIESGLFGVINWGAGNYWMQVEMDPLGGTNFTDMGASQLLSVPFALYSDQSGTPGPTGATGVTGPTGILPAGTASGNTTYWDGTDWVLNSDNLYNSGSKIGIGTSNPTHKLDVIGSNSFVDGNYSFYSTLNTDIGQYHGMFYNMVNGYKGFAGMNRTWYDSPPYDSLRMSMIIFDSTKTHLVAFVPYYEQYWGLRIKVTNGLPNSILSNMYSNTRGVDVGLYINAGSVLLRSVRGHYFSKIALDTNSMALKYSYSKDSAATYLPRFAVDTLGNAYIAKSLGVNLPALGVSNSTFQVSGSMSANVVNLTASDSPYDVLSTDFSVFFTTGNADCILNLPPAIGSLGRIYILKKIDAAGTGTLTIYPDGTETIDGSASIVLPASAIGIMRVQSDGLNWQTW